MPPKNRRQGHPGPAPPQAAPTHQPQLIPTYHLHAHPLPPNMQPYPPLNPMSTKLGVPRSFPQPPPPRPPPTAPPAVPFQNKSSKQPNAANKNKKPGMARGSITVDEIQSDRISKLALVHWPSSPSTSHPQTPAQQPTKAQTQSPQDIIQLIYKTELGGGAPYPPAARRIALLEMTGYLERCLWRHFPAHPAPPPPPHHIISIIILINEKLKQNIPIWGVLNSGDADGARGEDGGSGQAAAGAGDKFKRFMDCALTLPQSHKLSYFELNNWLSFYIHAFRSLETPAVCAAVLKLVSLYTWHSLSQQRLRLELHANAEVYKYWTSMVKKEKKKRKKAEQSGGDKYIEIKKRPEALFIEHLIEAALDLINNSVIVNRAQLFSEWQSWQQGGEPSKAVGDKRKRDEEVSNAEQDKQQNGGGGEINGAQGNGVGVGEVGSVEQAEGAQLSDIFKQHVRVVPKGSGIDHGEQLVIDQQALYIVERYLELFIDLMSQLSTRRFVAAVLDESALLTKCTLSRLYQLDMVHVDTGFSRLVTQLEYFMAFPIDDYSGESLSADEVAQRTYKRIALFQALLHARFPPAPDAPPPTGAHASGLDILKFASCADTSMKVNPGEVPPPGPKFISKHLADVSMDTITQLTTRELCLVRESDPDVASRAFLEAVLVSKYKYKSCVQDLLRTAPVYPTETTLFSDKSGIPPEYWPTDRPISLPKLNLQYLTLCDMFMRSMQLYQLESCYEIRADVEDMLKHIRAAINDDDNVVIQGWARMATKLATFTMTSILPPKIHETSPQAVHATAVINTADMRDEVAAEWDQLRQHDVLFLVGLQPQEQGGEGVDVNQSVRVLRGCEIVEIRDEDGKLMNDFTGRVRFEDIGPPAGHVRTLLLALSPEQYQLDVEQLRLASLDTTQDAASQDVYSMFNILLRRKGKENNFKAVLQCIRQVVEEEVQGARSGGLPAWLTSVLLGYDDPAAACFYNMPQEDIINTVDFKDTFLDYQHLVDSFPYHKLELKTPQQPPPPPPYRLTFPGPHPPIPTTPPTDPEPAPIIVTPSPAPPLPPNTPPPPKNTVRFTPTQIHALMAGIQPGLTLVQGPPGTGKTDTAVQILSVLYHNVPQQRVLVLAHSNQALNDLFDKLLLRDVPERYLLRLGVGEAELSSEHDFSRQGRVNIMLSRRLELLAEVERLSRILNVDTSAAQTCETAGYFWIMHVLNKWELFTSQCEINSNKTVQFVKDKFPFTQYFDDVKGELFKGDTFKTAFQEAKSYFKQITLIFQQLQECRAFELLSSQHERVKYLLTKHAKVIAMTCTYAALKRHEFLEEGLQYDTIMMEEAGQVKEIESIIPCLLQKTTSRLKRIILIGDHHQLPPVVKNTALQKYAHFDQSLFSRLVRLGTPTIQLNAQGRCKPAIAKLFNWRYDKLGDLPHVSVRGVYTAAVPGLRHSYQFIDVPAVYGAGESEPVQYFYQNLDEAEYIVAVYCYLRLVGHARHSITILTSYNGQKQLLKEVVARKCAAHPALGNPAKITTVDKYQGQQNDIILLSLVRSRAFGHIRDVRRLVVALSRAKYGVFVFGNVGLFKQCVELQPAMSLLCARPAQLVLVPGEVVNGVGSRQEGDEVETRVVEGVVQMQHIVHDMISAWEQRYGQRRGS